MVAIATDGGGWDGAYTMLISGPMRHLSTDGIAREHLETRYISCGALSGDVIPSAPSGTRRRSKCPEQILLTPGEISGTARL